MMSNIYDIIYSRLVKWWTPAPLRTTFWLSWLGVMVKPVADLYNSFLLYRTARLYQLMITPQKCWLERLLNDRYDNTLRRIYIEDGIDKPPFYIFQRAESKPKFIRQRSEAAPQWIYTSGESGNLVDDFIVFVPMALVFEEPEMVSLVKVYKLAGVKFKIQRF